MYYLFFSDRIGLQPTEGLPAGCDIVWAEVFESPFHPVLLTKIRQQVPDEHYTGFKYCATHNIRQQVPNEHYTGFKINK